jgi:hypothetical protein
MAKNDTQAFPKDLLDHPPAPVYEYNVRYGGRYGDRPPTAFGLPDPIA